MNNHLTIRSADISDIRYIVKLMEDSINDNAQGFRADAIESNKKFAERLIKSRLGGGKSDLLVGELNGMIIAVCGLDQDGMQKTRNIVQKILSSSENIPEIARLHVDKDMKGKGYGRAMVDNILHLAKDKNSNAVQLHVTDTQKSAIHLYKKMGFEPFNNLAAQSWKSIKQKDNGSLRFLMEDGREYPTNFFYRDLQDIPKQSLNVIPIDNNPNISQIAQLDLTKAAALVR